MNLESRAEMKRIVDEGVLNDLLSYDPILGTFTWKQRPLKYSKSERLNELWNARFAGTPAFQTSSKFGYFRGMVLGCRVAVHRAAWAIYYGEWPHGMIDHIDGDPTNNRIANLRAVDAVANARNRGISTRNTSGAMGVRWIPNKSIYRAEIRGNDGKQIHLGNYHTLVHAEVAYAAAKRVLGYHVGHGQRRGRALIAQTEGGE